MTEFPQRQIGRTRLRVTELGLGCATLGGSQIAVARAAAEEIVGAAWAGSALAERVAKTKLALGISAPCGGSGKRPSPAGVEGPRFA